VLPLFCRQTPQVLGRLLRDFSIAGLQQAMSGTAYENHAIPPGSADRSVDITAIRIRPESAAHRL